MSMIPNVWMKNDSSFRYMDFVSIDVVLAGL